MSLITADRKRRPASAMVKRIGDIVAGKRAVTADTGLQLAFEFNAARFVTVL